MFESHHQLQGSCFCKSLYFLSRIKELIRNLPLRAILHQVVCSSHITSSNSRGLHIAVPFVLRIKELIRNLPLRAMLHQVVCSSHIVSSRKKPVRKNRLFSMKRTLQCMKNEAGFAYEAWLRHTESLVCASLHRSRKTSASCEKREHFISA